MKLTVEPLDAIAHDRSRFVSGQPSVDRYLRSVARQAGDRFVARSYVLVAQTPRAVPCEIIGYYTLVQQIYRDGELGSELAQKLGVRHLGAAPVVLLAQLGIGVAYQRRGIGDRLLRHALRRSLLVGLSAGAVAIVTDPIDASAERFYRERFFTPFAPGKRLGMPMALVARFNPEIVEAFHRDAGEISFAPPERNTRALSRVMRA